jgi:hypothetical protein
MFVAALAAAAALAAGCGGSSSPSNAPSSSPTSGATLTAQQIADKSTTAMATVKSASFALDLSATIKGDASKAPDAQTKALLSGPISLKAQGSISNEPQKADLTLNASAAGQKLDVGLKMDGGNIWIQYKNQWYETSQAALGGLTGSSPAPSASSAPLTQQLQGAITSLGIDPSKWTEGYTLVGTESLDGTEVYHVAQTLNVSQFVDDLVKLVQTAGSLTGGLGGASASPGTQITPQDAQTLKDALKGLKIDWYYQKDNYDLRKMMVAATMDLSKDSSAAASGVTGIDFSLTLTTSNFDQPVTVQPPSPTKPIQDLLQALTSSGGLGL